MYPYYQQDEGTCCWQSSSRKYLHYPSTVRLNCPSKSSLFHSRHFVLPQCQFSIIEPQHPFLEAVQEEEHIHCQCRKQEMGSGARHHSADHHSSPDWHHLDLDNIPGYPDCSWEERRHCCSMARSLFPWLEQVVLLASRSHGTGLGQLDDDGGL